MKLATGVLVVGTATALLAILINWSRDSRDAGAPAPDASNSAQAAKPSGPPTNPLAQTAQASHVAPAKSDAAKEWNTAFSQAKRENIRVTMHRAATTGSLVDAVAAKQAIWRCRTQPSSFQTAKYLHKEAVSESMRKVAERIDQQCDGLGDLPIRDLYEIKNDAGFGDLSSDLQINQGLRRDQARRELLLQRVLETRSIELLDYVRPALLDSNTMPLLGITPSSELPPMVDTALLQLAIQLRACNERGDCDRVAQENFQCLDYNACVSDLNSFPEERIFGTREKRALIFQNSPNPNYEASIRKRWAELQSAVNAVGK